MSRRPLTRAHESSVSSLGRKTDHLRFFSSLLLTYIKNKTSNSRLTYYVFVSIFKVHYWEENIGHPPCYCLVDFGSELRQSSFQLHFVQILASWWKRKQARKGHLVTWQWPPGYLVFPKVENTFQGGISVAATICCPLVGKCLATR